MKRPNRQLIIGSLQPLFFCVGMYFVVLIFSIFVCSSIYRVLNPKKMPSIAVTQTQAAPNTGTGMVAMLK